MYGKGYGSLYSVDKKSEAGVPQRELDVETIRALGRRIRDYIGKISEYPPENDEAKRTQIEEMNKIDYAVFQANDRIGKRYEQLGATLSDKISNSSEDNINSQTLADESIS